MVADREVDAALLLYHHFPTGTAPTITEHVHSFERYSRFPIVALNTDDGYPPALDGLEFKAVILHYSVFAGPKYFLGRRFLKYLERTGTPTITFFQDEHRYCSQRFDFVDRYGVDTVYTLLDPPYGEEIYRKHTAATNVHTTLTGYVGDDLVERAAELSRPDDDRAVDVGYRARRLPTWTGRGAQEKHEIAERFVERAADRGLRLDIATGERSLIRGDAWYQFVAGCRAMLGVEAGVSVFDLDGTARERTVQMLAERPGSTFDDLEREILHEYEDRIPYRTLSPRHLEAAAFRVVQILYEGHYSGVLEPDVHYLALAKDLSNFDDVMRRLEDPAVRRSMTDRAHDDLIASGRYDYRVFFASFDEHLADLGLREGAVDPADLDALGRRSRVRRMAARGRSLRTRPFPGRRFVGAAYEKVRGRAVESNR